MDARRSLQVSAPPRHAAVPDKDRDDPRLDDPRLTTLALTMLIALRSQSTAVPVSQVNVRRYLTSSDKETGIPNHDWSQLLVSTFDQRWRSELSHEKVLAGYAEGVAAFGAYGQPLVNTCITRLQSALVQRGNPMRSVNTGRALCTAIAVAGTQEQIQRALPSFAGTWTQATAACIVDSDAHHIGRHLAVRAVGIERTPLIHSMQALAPSPNQPWTQGELLASRLLVDVGDCHPSAVALVRGLAVNVMPPMVNQKQDIETRSFWEDGASRNDSVITWCDQQVRQGRVQLIRNDDTLRDAVLATAISGSLPGTDSKDGDGIHALACQVAAQLTAAE